jgi:prepilin-type N-terminal cleavage/methylation domain-containing protein
MTAHGFTLVELAVVLTIAAILFAIVLKSTSVTDSARANDLIAIAGDLSDAARQFRDKYKYLPGDDPTATTDLPGPGTANGDGDGLIDAAEPNLVANHLFQAGLIRVSPNTGGGFVMKSYYGNVWLMSFDLASGTGGTVSPCGSAIVSAPTAPPPVARNVIVFANIPSAIARQIDQKYDDGLPHSGSIRASVTATQYDTSSSAPAVACFAMPL